jgi:hypothetical protein
MKLIFYLSKFFGVIQSLKVEKKKDNTVRRIF